jgi:Tol biopolymer transport system component/DNA-binding winged helix-turn-helix (wHTH) protein
MRSPTIAFGPFVFDPDSGMLKKDGADLPLPPRVTGVLGALLRRPGDVVLRQELMDSVWKDAFVTDTSLAEAVSVLRQTLGDDAQSPAYIQTLHRRGYRWVAPVVERPGSEEDESADAGAVEAGPITVSPSIGRQLVPWSVAVVCLILAATAVRQALTRRETTLPVVRFAIASAPDTWFDQRSRALAISPDGSRVVWSACDHLGCRLYLRDLSRLGAVALEGTDGAAAPFFSPDGLSIGFFASGRLKRLPLTGGTPAILAEASDPLGAVWIPSKEIIFAGSGQGLKVMSETGGDARSLTTPRQENGEVRHVWPAYQSANNLLIFSITSTPGGDSSGRLAALRLDARRNPWTTLLTGVGNGAFVSADVLVVSRGAELQAVPFDVRRGAVTGAPQVVLNSVSTAAGAAQFATSSTGGLVTLGVAPSPERPSFFWLSSPTVARGDVVNRAAAAVRQLESVALAPDGQRIAGVDRADSARPEIWIADLERGTSSRLTHERLNVSPVWSPDGTTVFFASSDGAAFAIYERDADSSRPARRLYAGSAHCWPTSVSPDGSRLVFTTGDAATGLDVWTLPIQGGPPQALIRTPFDESGAVFSPQGDLVAYQSNEAGRWEIFVQRPLAARRMTVSTDGGTHPFWSADGRELFFQAGDRLMRAVVSNDGANIGTPALVRRFIDSSPIGIDRQGRLLWQRSPRVAADAAVLTLEWVREARQLLGPPAAVMPR